MLAMFGCSSNNNKKVATAQVGSKATVAGKTATPAAQEPKRGGTLQMRQLKDFNFDALTNATPAPSHFFAANVYSSIIRNVAGKTPTETFNWGIEGDLAVSWQQPDHQTYIFKLRPGVKTHNKPPVNGRELTADDIVQSMHANMTEERNATRKGLGPVDGFPTAIDSSTIQIKTTQPFAPFLANLAYRNAFWIYPKELLANDEIRVNSPVGTGPFMFKAKQDGSFWDFDANPDFYRKDEAGRKIPFAAGVRYNIVPEEATAIAQFQAGNLDRLDTVSADNLGQVQKVKGANLIESLEFLSSHDNVWPQQRRGPFQDERLRQALSLSIDRDAMLHVTGGGHGDWNNICNKVMGKWWLNPRGKDIGDTAKFFKQDQAEAKKLIDAAGFHDSFNATYSNGYGDAFSARALFEVDQFKQVGMKPSAVQVDHKSQWSVPNGTFFGNYEGVALSAQTGYPHAHIILNNILHTGGAHNVGGCSDAQLDGMIDALGQEFDEAAAIQKAFNIQRYAMQHCFFIPTIINSINIATQPRINNVYVDQVYQFDSVERAWISA
jgi:peptide/nickel transport system substrate-binding protein